MPNQPNNMIAFLGVGEDDTLTVAEQTFTLAATWRANDPTATRWFADSAIASGHDGLSLGPVVLDERALSALSAPRAPSYSSAAR